MNRLGNMPCRVVRAFVCSAGLLLACVCVPAAAAPNLLTNGGFETFGAGQTVFSDSLPDLAAWTTVSGGFTLAGGILTSNGAGSSRDLAIVANSSDYTAGTMQAVITPVDVQPQLTGGVVSRYQGADDHYACGITKNSLVLLRRLAGVETTLGSTAFTTVSGTAYRVSLSAAGSSLTCRVQAVAGGATASTTATDGSFASGAIGLFSANANPTQVRRNRFSQPLMTATPPDGWSTIQTASGRPGLIPDVVSPVNSGVAYLQLFSGSAAFAGSSVQTVGAVGGFTYTLQGAIRTDAVAGTAQVMAVESPGGATTVLGDVSGTTPWTVYSTSFTTQPSTTQIAVRTRIAGSGRASFDDLSLSAATLISLSLSASSIHFGSSTRSRRRRC